MVLDHPLPMALAWGPELIVLFNDAYHLLLARKGDALGRRVLEVWSEARDIMAPQLASTLAGKAHRCESAPLPVLRGDGAEQAFFDYSLSPVRDEAGAVVGILHTTFETTGRVSAEHRQVEVNRALQESETRFRALVTAGTYSSYRVSPDWRIMYPAEQRNPGGYR